MKLIIAIITILIISGCNSAVINKTTKWQNIQRYKSCKDVMCLNARLIDTCSVDTIAWEMSYNTFMNGIDKKKRKKEIIYSLLKTNEKEITNQLRNIISKHEYYQLIIQKNGSLKISKGIDKEKTDSSTVNKVNKELSKITLEDNVDFVTILNLNIENDKIILDKIIYSPHAGRSRKNVLDRVATYLAKLRYAYNRRLVARPGLKGRITIKFTLNQYGNIIFCEKLSSTIEDLLLEDAIVMQINNWKFNFILIPGDEVEFVFPFVFSQ